MDVLAPPRRLTPEQQALASDPRHLRLAEGIAAKFGKRFPPLADEFEAEAMVALCQAAATFDAGAGASFKTHATARLEGAMRDTCRNWTAQGFRRKSEDAPLTGSIFGELWTDDSGEPQTLADTIASEDELAGLSSRLPTGMGHVVRSLYGRADLVTMKAAGRAGGLSESRVSQLHALAGARLVERFPEPEDIFMNGHARSKFLVGARIGPESITPGEDEEAPAAEAPEAPPTPAIHAGASCPECGTEYKNPKYKRCQTCKPVNGRPTGAAPATNGHAPRNRIAGLDSLDLADAGAGPSKPKGNSPGAGARVTSARAELRAMDEILSIAERLGPAARRVLAWVSDRVGDPTTAP
jgi:hypothetical protein